MATLGAYHVILKMTEAFTNVRVNSTFSARSGFRGAQRIGSIPLVFATTFTFQVGTASTAGHFIAPISEDEAGRRRSGDVCDDIL
jgi:hypothetical protein